MYLFFVGIETNHKQPEWMPNMRRAKYFHRRRSTQREKIINSMLNDLDYARFNHLLISSDIKLFDILGLSCDFNFDGYCWTSVKDLKIYANGFVDSLSVPRYLEGVPLT